MAQEKLTYHVAHVSSPVRSQDPEQLFSGQYATVPAEPDCSCLRITMDISTLEPGTISRAQVAASRAWWSARRDTMYRPFLIQVAPGRFENSHSMKSCIICANSKRYAALTLLDRKSTLKLRKNSNGKILGARPIASRKDMLYRASCWNVRAADGWISRDSARLFVEGLVPD